MKMANITLRKPENGLHNMIIGKSLLGATRNHMSPMGLLKVSPQSSLSSSPTSENSQGFEFNENEDSKATELAKSFIEYKLHGTIKKSEDEVTKTLRRMCDEFISKHPTVINAIAKRLRYSEASMQLNEDLYVEIADEIFEDGQVNWGRIVSLFVLGAILAGNDKEVNNGQNTRNIIQYVGNYIDRKSNWIERNNGWEGFVKYFNKDNNDSTVWKGILLTAACAAASCYAISR